MESLDVYLKGCKVGILRDEPKGLAFSYDADYAAVPGREWIGAA